MTLYLISNHLLLLIKREKAVKILKLGTPTAIQNGVTSISFMIITTLVNIIGGVNASAAVGVVAKFNSFAVLPAVAMGASISTMCAQNIGAGKWDRAVKTCKSVQSSLLYQWMHLYCGADIFRAYFTPF